jgi:hypothetical protein
MTAFSPVAPSLRIGLTGGIGSGKSTVALMLREAGATIVDTDAIARELTATGGAAMPALAHIFGPSIIAGDGSLNRIGLCRRNHQGQTRDRLAPAHRPPGSGSGRRRALGRRGVRCATAGRIAGMACARGSRVGGRLRRGHTDRTRGSTPRLDRRRGPSRDRATGVALAAPGDGRRRDSQRRHFAGRPAVRSASHLGPLEGALERAHAPACGCGRDRPASTVTSSLTPLWNNRALRQGVPR